MKNNEKKLMKDFWRISPSGRATRFRAMSTAKFGFALTGWRREGVLFALGGCNGENNLN